MKRKFLWSLTVSFLMIPAFGEVVFPEAKEIPERLKMPLHAKLSVDADGNLLVNGKIRYLIGVKMVSGSPYKDLQPRGGYPESLKWLYEVPMNREAMYRLGFDLISVNGCPSWLKEIDSKRNFDWSGIELYYRTGLPVHLDVGGFAPWEAGMARLSPYREKLPPEAINPFEGRHGTHWVPYSVFHPAGRELYRKHWKRSLEFARKNGAEVFRMELFNEPSYNDPESRYNRELFARYLGKKYGTVGKMNANWNSSFATFEAAAAKFSDDKYSKMNGGIVSNHDLLERYSAFDAKLTATKFLKEDFGLGGGKSIDDYNAIRVLKEGEISPAYRTKDLMGNDLCKIVKLVEVIPSHPASLDEDYLRIEQMALVDKQQRMFNEWINRKIDAMYVYIEPEYRDGEFINKNWVK